MRLVRGGTNRVVALSSWTSIARAASCTGSSRVRSNRYRSRSRRRCERSCRRIRRSRSRCCSRCSGGSTRSTTRSRSSARCSATGTSRTVLRLPMVYGPGDSLRRFLPVVKRVDDRRPAIMFATNTRAGKVRAASRGCRRGDRAGRSHDRSPTRLQRRRNRELTELAWAERIAAAAGWTGGFVTLPAERMPPHLLMPGNTDQHWTSTRRASAGWASASVSQADAISRTIEWERANPTESSPHAFDYDAEDAALRSALPSIG